MIDSNKALSALNYIWTKYDSAILAGLFNVAAAAAIFVIGGWIAGRLAALVRRAAKRSQRIDDTLGAFLASLVRYAILAFVILAVLQRFGVQTTSIVAVLGAATLAIGLALQGTLSNVAAGVMLVLFRPYKLGDFVEIGGQQGSVKDITLFTTELATLQNVAVVLPNSACWGAAIQNFSTHARRRIDLDWKFHFETDLHQAIGAIAAVLACDPRVLADPAPWIKPNAIGDYFITIQARFWCANSDMVDLRSDMIAAIKNRLNAAQIPLAVPTTRQFEIERR